MSCCHDLRCKTWFDTMFTHNDLFLSAIFKSRNRKLGMAPQITRGARGIYQRSNSDSNKSWIFCAGTFLHPMLTIWFFNVSRFSESKALTWASCWPQRRHKMGNLEWIFRSLEARNKQLQPHTFLDRCKTWPNRLRLWVKYGVCFFEPAQTLRPQAPKTQRHHWECRNVFRTVVKNIQGLVGYIKATRETECNGAEKRVWFHCFQHEVLLPPRSPMTPWKKFVYTCNETNRWVLFNQFSHVASNTCNNAKIRKHTTLALHCENWLFQGKVRQRQICSNNPAIKVALQWNPGGHAQISGEQLRIPCTSGNSHWLQLLQHQKRSKFTSQEHHKNSQKFPPLFLLSKISPWPGKTPWKVEVWASHPAGKIDPKEMTAGGYVLSSDYSMAVPNKLLLTGRGILGNGNPPEICFSWTPRQACMIQLAVEQKMTTIYNWHDSLSQK